MAAPVTPSVMLNSKTCVVVGGGATGQLTAEALLKKGVEDVVIVQGNPFVENPIMSPWFLTRPEAYVANANSKKGSACELSKTAIDGVKYVIGVVTALEGNQLVFADGRKLGFGACVMCVGHHYPALMPKLGETFKERKAFVESFPQKVLAANSILVGGAGPVALEFSAELRRINPDCTIQMVTPGDGTLGWTGTAASRLKSRLKKTRIGMISNARISNVGSGAVFEKQTYTLSTGQTIQDVDMFLPFFGSACTEFLPKDMLEASRRGKIKANLKGQSTVRDDVFVVGCGDKYTVSIEPNFKKEADVVGANVSALFKGKPLAATLPETQPEASVFYVHMGIGQYSIMNLGQKGCLPGFCGWFCGCCNPLCPCCAIVGWPCMFPASECQSKCVETVLIKGGGNKHFRSNAAEPVMASMTRD